MAIPINDRGMSRAEFAKWAGNNDIVFHEWPKDRKPVRFSHWDPLDTSTFHTTAAGTRWCTSLIGGWSLAGFAQSDNPLSKITAKLSYDALLEQRNELLSENEGLKQKYEALLADKAFNPKRKLKK